MYDPISVETALVSSGGDLLIQLSDGNVVNAGRVRGNPGPQGEKGEQGVRGAHGKDGIDGTNGAQWHTGVGAPEIGLGVNGDLYMDVAAMVLPIYQKVNGDWLFLANLKGGGGGGGVGATGGGAAGDGSAIIIKPGPTPPTNDNDGNPVDTGDLWWDSTTGLIYINTNNGWVAISDHPPAIVSPDPPLYTNNSDPTDPNKRYPIRVGDLWMDSDQGALYVAMKDSDDDMVWVISTPANRDILQTEISAGFVIPANAADGDTFYNAITDTWYIYNQPKKQWIDLPPGERELSFPGILLEADPAIDDTFEGTGDGNVYINNPDHEPVTRLVVRRIDSKGFDWSDILSEVVIGDGISLVQQVLLDPIAETYETQRVDYLIGDVTANTDSYSFLVTYDKQNLDRDPLFGEPVSVRFLAQVQPPAVCVNYSDTAPDPKCVGHLWFDNSDDELTLYIYTGTEWIPAAPPVSLDGINATINAALIVQNELLARVEAGEVVQTGVLQDILTLQQEIDALENTRYVGTWNALDDGSKNGRPPGDGNFYFNQGALATDWSLVGWIYIANVDSNGVTFTHNDIEVGDQIEVISKTDNSYGIYTIQDTTDAGDYVAIQIETMNRSDGTPATGSHLIKIFSIDTGLDLNDADARYLRKTGGTMTGSITSKVAGTSNAAFRITDSSDSAALDIWAPSGTGSQIKYVGANDTKHWFQNYNTSGSVKTTLKLGYQDYSFLAETGITYSATDAHRVQGAIHIGKGNKGNQFKISPNAGSDDYATNIYALNGGPMRFRTSHTEAENDYKSHIVLTADATNPTTKIYHVTEAGDSAAVPRSYVDAKVAEAGGGVPVGCIMIWMNSTAPAGWFKLQGGSFDINANPQLHAYLQSTSGYTPGRLPNWSGRFPGEYGDHALGSLGAKLDQRTAKPNTGTPKSSRQFPDGSTRTFTATGNTNAYSAGTRQVEIDTNWDSVTRPPMVLVHYIIKGD